MQKWTLTDPHDGLLVLAELGGPSDPDLGVAQDEDGEWFVGAPQSLADDVTAALARLPALRAAAIARIRGDASRRAIEIIGALSAPIMAQYPPGERESWSTQAVEARAVKAGAPASAAPTLVMLAQGRGITLDAMADLVIAASLQFAAVAAAEQALRREAEALLAAATTPEEIETALAAIGALAGARAAEMGLAQ
jgi:hypothetical protein